MHPFNDSIEQQDRILTIIDGIGNQCVNYDTLKESRDMPMVCFSCEHLEDCYDDIYENYVHNRTMKLPL